MKTFYMESMYKKIISAMEDASTRLLTVVIISLLVSGIFYSCLWNQASNAFFDFEPNNILSNKTQLVHKDELQRALEGASMGNKTVIISVINKAYAEENGMLDLFLQSLRLGEDTEFLINHLLLTAVDEKAYNRCTLLHLHCYRLFTEGVDFSKEEIYMSPDFVNMMWRRTLFLGDVLRRGYSFLFTDMDVIWLRNPFPKLGHGGEDMQISCDWYTGWPFDISNPINTGFYFVASSNKTITLFDAWYASRNNSRGMKEQDVLAKMISHGVFNELGMKVRFLDVLYFAGFCKNNKSFKEMRTIHANCCRSVKAKLADLSVVLEDWTKYKKNNSMQATNFRWPEHKACNESWTHPI